MSTQKLDSFRIWFIAVIALGITSIIAQIIIIREFFNVFYGNELVIGLVLANWMLFTGLGAYLGKFVNKLLLNPVAGVLGVFLIGVLPVIQVFLLHYLRIMLFLPGSMLGIFHAFYMSLLVLFPFCLLSGILFTQLCVYISSLSNKNLIGRVYAVEAAGSIIGGLLFNFIFIYLFNTFESLIILAIIDLAIVSMLAVYINRKRWLFLFVPFTVILIFTGSQFEVDKYIKSLLYPDQQIVYQQDTPYGNLVVARQNKQLNFYENNVLLCSDQEVKDSEETVHYAMTQHRHPVNVLLIGNGISGTLKEMLKYDIERLDYVERNPWMIRLAKKYNPTIDNEKVHVINQDARLYVKQTDKDYDVVILDIPEPVTAEMNRYYTLEFFRELKQCLEQDAIVSFSLASTADYVSEEAASFYSVIYKTAKKMFEHVMIIPGGKNYFLCSDYGLTYRIPEIIEQKNIHTDYVNKYYMDIRLLKQRSEFISGQLDKDARVNKDFKPVGYLLQLNYWLSYFKINYWIVISVVGIVVLLLLLLSVKNPVNMGLFFAGFTGSTLEIVLLLAFQVIYGYVYHVLGIVIMVFMGGLAVGAMYRKKFISPASLLNYSLLQFVLGMYAILLPFILLLFKKYHVHPYLLHGVFFSLTFIASLLVGMIFNLASFQRKGNIAGVSSEIYSVDLWGAAAGALLVSAFLIPVFGLINVALIAGILMLLSGIYSMAFNFKRLA